MTSLGVATGVATGVSVGSGAAPASPPVLEASEWTSGGSLVSAIVLNAPAGVTAGELLIAQLCYEGGSSRLMAAVAGWTLLVDTLGAKGAQTGVYWRISTGAEASITPTITGGTKYMGGWFSRYSNVHQTVPIHGSEVVTLSPSNQTAHVVTGLTTTAPNILVTAALAFDGADGATWGISGTGWTKTREDSEGTGTFKSGGVLAHLTQLEAGATGSVTLTSAQADGSEAVVFGIAPP